MHDAAHPQPPPAAGQWLRPARFPFISALAGRALSLGYLLTGKDRYDDFRLEWVRGAPILVTPSVFNPRLLRTGAFFAAHIHAGVVTGDAEVLDMGTGSGVCAVFAARLARRVVAVDINVAAVRCAALNALLNHCEQRVEVRHGDLFAPVANERFDLILFNPPFLRGTPRDDRDRAWRSTDVAERFAADLRTHLKPDGCALVLLSTFGRPSVFLEQLRRQRFALSLLAERRFVNERLAILRVEPAAEGSAL
jgi:methylase of polypeptide subunit release factors